MTTHSDIDRFKNHSKMREELKAAGVTIPSYAAYIESHLVHLYDITFLVGCSDFVAESRKYRPPGTRIATGPYTGQFPTTHSKTHKIK